jgi:hypothetical protein
MVEPANYDLKQNEPVLASNKNQTFNTINALVVGMKIPTLEVSKPLKNA